MKDWNGQKENQENNSSSEKKSKEQRSLTQRFQAAYNSRQERRLEKDMVFSEPLTPAPPVDERAPLRRGSIDIWFLLWAMILVCLGTVMLYSASAVYAEQEGYDSSAYFLWRQIIFIVISSVITAFLVLFARPYVWRFFGVGAYAASIFLLLLVLVIGAAEGDAQRWIDLGFITIQPSEIAKTAVIMVLAMYMSKHQKEISSTGKFMGSFKHGFFVPMLIIGVLCALIALENHISGLMIVGLIGLVVMFLGGTRLKYILIFLGLMAGAFLVLVAISSYAQARVDIWLNIDEADPLGSAWQTLQGLYAIGSGGFFGLGLGFSRQKFGYVSQPQNDFIFTIICEELGFLGALLVVLLFGLLIWRGIRIGQRAPDQFSALVVWGLTFKIALQVAMNIAVVTNMMPNTGISLPFFSAGGTSLMVQILEIGIILSISRFSTKKK